MDKTSLFSRRMEIVRAINESIHKLEIERAEIDYILRHQSFSDVMRRELESDCALLDEAISELGVTKCIVRDKVNVQASKQSRPRLYRVK